MKIQKEILNYYSEIGKLTDLGKYRNEVEKIPNDDVSLVSATQNMIVHDMWLERYGVTFKKEQCFSGSCTMESILNTLQKTTNKNPFAKNEIQQRTIACCREFAVMLCALFRAKGIPARGRCGFASYLAHQGKYEDHWVCEAYRNKKWGMIDPQIDSFQLDFIQSWAREQTEINQGYKSMLLELNPMDITERDFMVAGKAWKLSRNGTLASNNFGLGVDPQEFGLESTSGIWFIRGNLIRDFLALNKIEIDPFVEGIEKRKDYWNNWRIIISDDENLTDLDWKLLDTIAELTIEPDKNFDEILNVYESNQDLHPPTEIFV